MTEPAAAEPILRLVAFDFGGPVLLTPFELLRRLESRLGLPVRTFDWGGPFEPERDPGWRRLDAGELSERDYWARRAAEFDRITGLGDDPRDLFTAVFDADPELMIRPSAVGLLDRAHRAGLRTAVLSNDLGRFHSERWIASIPFLRQVDAVVDGSVTGVLKPDPEAYRMLLRRFGVRADETLFIDDQAVNVRAARQVGLRTVLLDPTDCEPAYRAAGELLDPPRVPSFGS